MKHQEQIPICYSCGNEMQLIGSVDRKKFDRTYWQWRCENNHSAKYHYTRTPRNLFIIQQFSIIYKRKQVKLPTHDPNGKNSATYTILIPKKQWNHCTSTHNLSSARILITRANGKFRIYDVLNKKFIPNREN